MAGLFIRWLILTLAVLLAAYLLDGIHVAGFGSALVSAALLSFLNAVLRPILLILTLPLTVLSLGLFTFVINALLLMMVSGVVGGLTVTGFGAAFVGSLVISTVSFLLSLFVSDRGKFGVVDVRYYGGRNRDRLE